MAENKGLDAWEELFRAEQKGRSPGDFTYSPVEGIEVKPYSSYQTQKDLSLNPEKLGVVHSLVVDAGYGSWIDHSGEILKDYHIVSILSRTDPEVNPATGANQIVLTPKDNSGPASDGEKLSLLDFGRSDILHHLRNAVDTLDVRPDRITIIPGEDFIWNASLCRALLKYCALDRHQDHPHNQLMIYIPLDQLHSAGDEGQLIDLTNKILSLMICGLNHCVWDVRNATGWQKMNYSYLFNVPEVLVREGRVLGDEDPLQGSNMFEELSDRVLALLRK